MPNYNWKFPLSLGTNGYFDSTKSVEDMVKENIKNLLLTEHGERVAKFNYGTNIKNLLFDMKDESLKSKLRFEVTSSIQKWVPHCKVTKVDIVYNEDLNMNSPYYGRVVLDENQVMINIYYNVLAIDGNFFVPNSISLIF